MTLSRVAGLAAFVWSLHAAPAGAQSEPAVRSFVIQVRPDPGITVDVVRREDGSHAGRCSRPCVFRLEEGTYRVQLRRAESFVGERRMTVERDAIWEVSPHDSTSRNVGLALGIAGPVLLFTGALLVMPVLMDSLCHDSDGCTTAGERQAAQGGVVALALGAVATPVGWTLFGRNVRPRVQVSSLSSTRERPAWSRAGSELTSPAAGTPQGAPSRAAFAGVRLALDVTF